MHHRQKQQMGLQQPECIKNNPIFIFVWTIPLDFTVQVNNRDLSVADYKDFSALLFVPCQLWSRSLIISQRNIDGTSDTAKNCGSVSAANSLRWKIIIMQHSTKQQKHGLIHLYSLQQSGWWERLLPIVFQRTNCMQDSWMTNILTHMHVGFFLWRLVLLHPIYSP